MLLRLNDCEGEVEIDDAIAPSIIELNRKGFVTFACCSGHDRPDSYSGYILFTVRLLRKYGEPFGCRRDVDNYEDCDQKKYLRQSKRIIRFPLPDDNKQERIDSMMETLRVWAAALPNMFATGIHAL